MAATYKKSLLFLIFGIWVVALIGVFIWLVKNNEESSLQNTMSDFSLQGALIFSAKTGDTEDIQMFSEVTETVKPLFARTDVNETLPTPSSTGSYLAYVVKEPTSEQIWIQTVDTRDLRLLTSSHQGHITSMLFSPNDRFLAFEEQIDNVPHLYLVDVAQGLITLIASDASGLTWGADSVRLFYHSPGSGTIQDQRIVSRRINEDQALTDAVTVLQHAVFPVALPDNRLLAIADNAGVHSFVTSTDRGEELATLYPLTIPDARNMQLAVSANHLAVALTLAQTTQIFDTTKAIEPWRVSGLEHIIVESATSIYGTSRNGIQKATPEGQTSLLDVQNISSLTLAQ